MTCRHLNVAHRTIEAESAHIRLRVKPVLGSMHHLFQTALCVHWAALRLSSTRSLLKSYSLSRSLSHISLAKNHVLLNWMIQHCSRVRHVRMVLNWMQLWAARFLRSQPSQWAALPMPPPQPGSLWSAQISASRHLLPRLAICHQSGSCHQPASTLHSPGDLPLVVR